MIFTVGHFTKTILFHHFSWILRDKNHHFKLSQIAIMRQFHLFQQVMLWIWIYLRTMVSVAPFLNLTWTVKSNWFLFFLNSFWIVTPSTTSITSASNIASLLPNASVAPSYTQSSPIAPSEVSPSTAISDRPKVKSVSKKDSKNNRKINMGSMSSVQSNQMVRVHIWYWKWKFYFKFCFFFYSNSKLNYLHRMLM